MYTGNMGDYVERRARETGLPLSLRYDPDNGSHCHRLHCDRKFFITSWFSDDYDFESFVESFIKGAKGTEYV